MQKCNLDISVLKFKIEMNMQHKDLLTFLFFVIYNGSVICKFYTINSWIQCKYILLLLYTNNLIECVRIYPACIVLLVLSTVV